MALTDTGNGGLSAADVAAVVGNNGGFGFGGNNGDLGWILILFLFGIFNGGWGNGGYGGYANVGSEIYPWMNQSQQVNDGFRDQMINGNIQGIQQSVTSGFGDVALGIAGINQNICQASNANQVAMLQGFNGMQAQVAQYGANAQLASCQTQNTIQNEGNMTRFAYANNTRDIIEANRNGQQMIMDKLCQLELDGVKNQLAQAQRENTALQNQVNIAMFEKSQADQNALFAQGMNNEVDALYNRLKNCPVGTTPVYGNTPIFTCNGNNGGCGCGNNNFIN
jgi:hypothetical protein